jgi:hypothetical protein
MNASQGPKSSNNRDKAVFGIYRGKSEIKVAKSELKSLGFPSADISILYPPHPGAQDFPQRQKSNVGKGALIGAIIGGVTLLVIASLVNSDLIPSQDLHAATGVGGSLLLSIVGILSGIGIGAACGALVGIGTPERAGQRYGDYVGAGGILMSVQVNNGDQEHQVKEVLDRTGAQDISVLKEGQGWDSVYSQILSNNHNHQLAH